MHLLDAGWRLCVCWDGEVPQKMYGSTFSTAWVMIQACDSTTEYVQTGWMENSGKSSTQPYYYWEWNNGAGYTRILNSVGPATDSSHTYEVMNSGGSYTGSEDGTTIGTVSDSNITWTPNAITYQGEIANTNAQSPGETADHVEYSSVEYYNGSYWYAAASGTWQADCSCQSIDDSSYSSGNWFDIWDNRY